MDASRDRPRLEYIPALDGVRGLAVAGVLLFHAHYLSGGFLGVDLFFTLSGFLITSLLVAEWRRDGSIDLGAFWARRARRLLPALFLLLAMTVLYAALFARDRELARLRSEALATLFYVANWWQIVHGQSYWEIFTSARPLAHTWSLAIEEQFYLVWPLLFLAITKLAGRRALPAVGVVAATLTVASAAAMMWLQRVGADPTRLYEGSDTRAASILVGALTAVLMARRRLADGRRGRVLEALGCGAAIAVVCSWYAVDGLGSDDLFRGGLLAHSIAGAAFVAAATDPASPILGRVLAWRPLRWLGTISYGVYLFHVPLFVVLTPERVGLDGWRLDAVRVIATLIVAEASYRLLERPVRYGALPPRRAVAALATATVALVVAILASTEPSWRADGDAVARAASTAGPTSSPGTRRVLIVGDSIGWTIGVGFDAIESERGITAENAGMWGCGISRADGTVRLKDGQILTEHDDCPQWRQRWTKAAAAFHPDDVVLILGAWDVADRKRHGAWTHPCAPGFDEWWRGELREALQALTALGARAHVTTMPLLRSDKLGLDDAESDRRIDCLNASIRIVAAVERVDVIDLADWVCPDRVCVTEVGGKVLRPDGMHFDYDGGPITASWLLDELDARSPRATP